MPTAKKVSRISLSVNPSASGPGKKQTADMVQKMVATMLGRAGCDGCGRIAYIDLGFLGDPGPDLGRLGGISLDVREG
ncbi:MAG TPA: hypothetical protein VLL54_04745 [Pyrinomonadaceae bacterium]|nr:hypothetical protein [Pyrinomonadaceae bacterium]